LQPFVELGIGLYLTSCLVMCIVGGKITVGLPFLCLFMAGYLYVPLTTWFGHAFARAQDPTESAGDLAPVVLGPPGVRSAARPRGLTSPVKGPLPDHLPSRPRPDDRAVRP
ncbi:MAG: hypothetical protein HY718_14940, partial [Planctomycetes bacterium]|nr:hypothetical protein [Planctomycetota bacterium]